MRRGQTAASTTGTGTFPGRRTGNGHRNHILIAPVYVPVYGGASGYYVDGGGVYASAYSPQQDTAVADSPQEPVEVSSSGLDEYGQETGNRQAEVGDTVQVYQAPVRESGGVEGQRLQEPSTGYLIALKDHTIYSAVAYWVEGDTLHYFTSSSSHNQASLSLVDRELTGRLNVEKGTAIRLPE
jgi:hypothetical protein